MKKPPKSTTPGSHLRRQAEQQLQDSPLDPQAARVEEAHRLLHELQVHQIELELQIAELAESEARYRILFESMRQGVFYQRADGALIDVNPAALEFFGLSRGDFLARTSLAAEKDVVDEHGKPLSGERLPSTVALISGRSVFDIVMGVLNAKTGERVWLLVNAIPQFQPGAARPHQVLVTLHDITARKQAEAALLASEERYRGLLEDQTDFISRVRADGTLMYANKAYCRFFGKRSDELIGGTWKPIAVPEDLSRIEAQIASLSPQSPTVTVEGRFYSGSGEVRWVQFANSAVFDAEGRVTEIQSVGRDITERVHAQEQLQNLRNSLEEQVATRTVDLQAANAKLQREMADRAQVEAQLSDRKRELERLGRLNFLTGIATGLAHELNQPIAAAQYQIAGALRMAKEGELKPNAVIDVLVDASSLLERIARTVRSVTALSSRRQAQVSTVDLAAVIAEAVEFLDFDFRRSGVSLAMEIPRDLPSIHVDRIHIQQMLLNVLQNALDSIRSAPNGKNEICIGARVVSGMLELFVSDTGEGFSRDALENLARPFFTTKEGGTGVGLSICRTILDTYRGRIWAVNNAHRG